MGDELPFWKYVVAGGLAGVMEISVMYPTDVLKTRAQLSSTRLTMSEAFKSVISTQGVGGFYRGVISPILAEAPKRAWKFSSNEKFKQFFKSQSATGEVTVPMAALSGTLSGVTEAIINCPFETVKVRMQSKEFVKMFKSTSECLVYLVKNEGITSVYKGLEAQMWRNGLWNGPYFGILGYINLRNKKAENVNKVMKSKGEKLFEKFYVGAFASCVGTLLNTPFDVIKSRMQAQTTEGKYRNSIQSLFVIRNEEGVRALYKGLAARLLRLGPGGGIMIVAFDFISGLLKDL